MKAIFVCGLLALAVALVAVIGADGQSPASAGGDLPWGDSTCDGDIQPSDARRVLAEIVGLTSIPECGPLLAAGFGSRLQVDGVERIWGDWRCDGDIDVTDALADLRHVAAMSPLSQSEPCPEIGEQVDIEF